MSSGAGLRVLDLDVEVAVVVEDARVEQLVLQLVPYRARVRRDEVVVRERGLRVLVEPALVGVRREVVDVEVVLLDVLAVVALGVRQAEQPLLEDRVAPVPQREREAQPLLVVADPGDAVLAPAVGARPGLVVGEVRPRVAVVAVVLADRAPLALAEVGPPGRQGTPARASVSRRSSAVWSFINAHPLGHAVIITRGSGRRKVASSVTSPAARRNRFTPRVLPRARRPG